MLAEGVVAARLSAVIGLAVARIDEHGAHIRLPAAKEGLERMIAAGHTCPPC